MSKYQVKISDTITYARECIMEIEAESSDKAKAIALEQARLGNYYGYWDREEIDATPYEVELVEDTDVEAPGRSQALETSK